MMGNQTPCIVRSKDDPENAGKCSCCVARSKEEKKADDMFDLPPSGEEQTKEDTATQANDATPKPQAGQPAPAGSILSLLGNVTLTEADRAKLALIDENLRKTVTALRESRQQNGLLMEENAKLKEELEEQRKGYAVGGAAEGVDKDDALPREVVETEEVKEWTPRSRDEAES